MAKEFGWSLVEGDGIQLWTKGYGKIRDRDVLARKLRLIGSKPSVADVEKVINSLDGHFALVAQGWSWTIAAVDRVRSVPVAYGEGSQGWVINDQAERLRLQLGLGEKNIDADAALSLAMSGYTIDVGTLYKGIHQLGPGELVLICDGEEPQRQRYYCYRPWRADKPSYNRKKENKVLADTLLQIVDEMMSGIGDRLLVVPLSAGRDSRAIVSAASHLGYKNIRTFAYGQEGNHEAKTSRYIAERLGYDWKFVPTDTSSMKRHYESVEWPAYCRFADSLQSTPFVQDLPQALSLKKEGYIPDDAVFANGNSGDYISGAHIKADMCEDAEGMTVEQRLARITASLCEKHFSLWQSLRTPENCQQIEDLLKASIIRSGAEVADPADDFGLYEYAEFQDRQCKYVISGQRIYEFLGHEWRLPLWDNLLLDFFERMPLEAKVGQRLYADTLIQENWGDVWRDVPVNRRSIKPNWVRPFRFLAKVAHAPFGKSAWHDFEKRYFSYWMELGAQSAIRSYRQVSSDRRCARHGVAWLTEAYLARHTLEYDGGVISQDA